jgi:hypothetical protein
MAKKKGKGTAGNRVSNQGGAGRNYLRFASLQAIYLQQTHRPKTYGQWSGELSLS